MSEIQQILLLGLSSVEKIYNNNSWQIIGPRKGELKGCLRREKNTWFNAEIPVFLCGVLELFPNLVECTCPTMSQGGWDIPQCQPLGGLLAASPSPGRAPHSSRATFVHNVSHTLSPLVFIRSTHTRQAFEPSASSGTDGG